ncbi:MULTISPECIES: hypothetical protein [Gammaproteobacteria]|uniref:hypothetical protein n=1 Tax=Gammaproteobacteria TaxID=1236 RepID=UPI001ADA289E|nr:MULTISPECIES: hypothetical protein [Gammaproteobacteria]MBO9496981.1 hypothetical protein [Thalassotalea sp. G20_0]
MTRPSNAVHRKLLPAVHIVSTVRRRIVPLNILGQCWVYLAIAFKRPSDWIDLSWQAGHGFVIR